MSSKIDKVCAEIEKVKAKISEQQSRLRELERQKPNWKIQRLSSWCALQPDARRAGRLPEGAEKSPAASGQVGLKSGERKEEPADEN